MKLFCIVGLFLGLLSGPAFARDPACEKGANGAPVLQTLRSCDRLYCSQPKEPATPSAIKAMDDTLTAHNNNLLELHDLVSSFERVCAKLVKDFCKDCPSFKQFQKLHFLIDLKNFDISKAEEELKDFKPTLGKINTVEGDLACYKQIKDLSAQVDPAWSDMKSRFRRTRCRP